MKIEKNLVPIKTGPHDFDGKEIRCRKWCELGRVSLKQLKATQP